MFVDDELFKEAKVFIGKSDDIVVFRRISDAVRLLNNKAKGNDWNVDYMDLCVYDGDVTLPAQVATILGVNNGGFPTLLRDQWFQFHINGPGNSEYTPWGYTDERGPVCTYRDPSSPVQLVAIVENSLDSNCKVRVFGYDSSGKRIYTRGANGVMEDGFLVPAIYGFSAVNPEAPSVAKIERIQKPITNGFIKLLAIDPDTGNAHTQIGYYLPWETTPLYRRISVPNKSWLRIKYRRKDIEVMGVGDWINIENRQALLTMLKSLQYRQNDQIDKAIQYEQEASRLLAEEAESLRPPAINGPQIIWNDGAMTNEVDRLIY